MKQVKTKPQNIGTALTSALEETPVVETVMPPQYLLELARGEEPKINLGQYSEVIRTLRNEKGFTFREIAEWLTDHGAEADHNSVYRIYTNHMSESEATQAAYEDQEDENGR